MNRTGIIYLATNQINGKRYIGKTVGSLSRRRSHHGCRGYAFYNALKKYGKQAFTWRVLCRCPLKDLDTNERRFIKEYDTCISNGGTGYNIQDGGNGAPYGDANPSKRPEVREKLRLAALGENNPTKRPDVKRKISQSLTGRKLVQSHKTAISRGMTGHFTPKGEKSWISKRCVITFPDGHNELIRGLLDYCRQHGLSYERLRYAQRKHGVSTDGFRVELYDDSDSKSAAS